MKFVVIVDVEIDDGIEFVVLFEVGICVGIKCVFCCYYDCLKILGQKVL